MKAESGRDAAVVTPTPVAQTVDRENLSEPLESVAKPKAQHPFQSDIFTTGSGPRPTLVPASKPPPTSAVQHAEDRPQEAPRDADIKERAVGLFSEAKGLLDEAWNSWIEDVVEHLPTPYRREYDAMLVTELLPMQALSGAQKAWDSARSQTRTANRLTQAGIRTMGKLTTARMTEAATPMEYVRNSADFTQKAQRVLTTRTLGTATTAEIVDILDGLRHGGGWFNSALPALGQLKTGPSSAYIRLRETVTKAIVDLDFVAVLNRVPANAEKTFDDGLFASNSDSVCSLLYPIDMRTNEARASARSNSFYGSVSFVVSHDKLANSARLIPKDGVLAGDPRGFAYDQLTDVILARLRAYGDERGVALYEAAAKGEGDPEAIRQYLLDELTKNYVEVRFDALSVDDIIAVSIDESAAIAERNRGKVVNIDAIAAAAKARGLPFKMVP